MDPDSSNFLITLFLVTSLVISFITSVSESAFRSLSIKRLEDLEGTNKKAKQLLLLLEEKTTLFSTIVTIKSISMGFLFTFLTYTIIQLAILGDNLDILLAFFVNSVFTFLFINLIPKYYAYSNPEKAGLSMYYPIKFLYIIFKPIISLVTLISSPMLSKIGDNFGKTINNITAAEIKDIVESSHKTGLLEHYDTTIMRSALTIEDLPVSSIITPRVDIESVSIDTSLKDTLDLMIKDEYSRLPVYEDNVDNIVGVVHIKDLLKILKTEPNNNAKSVKSFMRKVFHVPESKKVMDLLREMQAKSVQLAIVSDEYGGTSGLVTMEDILEEIVGEIRDEHDSDETAHIIEIEKDVFIADAMTSVEEINRFLDSDLPNNQTIGKLFFDSVDELPKMGQIKDIENVRIKVHEIDGIRVQKFIIKKVSQLDFPQSEKENIKINVFNNKNS
ncbi:MAG: hemolysin family protein [Cyanobacteriota bacterium]